MTLSSFDDVVQLTVNGETLAITESYQVQQSVFTVPGAFSVTAGHGRDRTLGELMAKFPPNSAFKMHIGPVGSPGLVPIMSGFTEGVSASDDSGSRATFEGRDILARLVDAYIPAELSFPEKSFVQITRQALDAVGLKDVVIDSDDQANQRAHAGVTVQNVVKPQIVDIENQEVNIAEPKLKTVLLTVKTQLGTRWFDFLRTQYERAGIFLWADSTGAVVLSAPNPKQEPTYRIIRKRGRNFEPGGVNVEGMRFRNDISERYTKAIVYGRGGRESGRAKVKGEFVDVGMVKIMGSADAKVMVVHDAEMKTSRDAEFKARYLLSQANRQNWTLSYTVSGHSTPALQPGRGRAVWTPNTVVDVQDDELRISGPHYLSSVTFNRDAGSGTTTELTLVRPGDLAFLPDAQFAKA